MVITQSKLQQIFYIFGLGDKMSKVIYWSWVRVPPEAQIEII